jgi:prevent-host-death family protein
MVRRMSAQQARDNFGELISSVYFTKEPVIVEKKSKPYAVLLSPERYDELLRREAQSDWALIEQLRAQNDNVDSDDLTRDVADAVEDVRAELFGESEGDAAGDR